MCGIFGIVNYNKTIKIQSCLKAFNLLNHRGPDNEGFSLYNLREKKINSFIGENSYSNLNYPSILSIQKINRGDIFFAHKRLSIIDLTSAGHQPMIFNNLIMTYNGEIYNFLEIRKYLISKGYIFYGNSDTEVLLKAYDFWGLKVFDKLNGQWAFAILDLNLNKIILSVDRFNIKQIYYYFDHNCFIFASEIKPIHSLKKTTFNENQIQDFLLWGPFEHNHQTVFNQINKIEPGCLIQYDYNSQKIHKQKYYILPNHRSKIICKSKDALKNYSNQLKEHLYDSVKLRLKADVPVGVLLSGGLDSSIITGIATEIQGKEFVNAFSIYFEDKKYSEIEYSRLVTQNLKINCKEFKCEYSELNAHLLKLLEIQEAPLFGNAVLAEWMIMKHISENSNIKVILSGLGGDELFAGYSGYYPFYYSQLLHNFKFPLFMIEIFSRLLNNINLTTLKKDILLAIIPEVIKNVIFKRHFNKKQTTLTNLFNLFHNEFNYNYKNVYSKMTLSKRQKIDVCKYFLLQLLRYSDRNSLHFSIEGRYPFLDHRLVEFAFSLPENIKIHHGWLKYILRKTFHNLLPHEIIWRKDKQGFPSPDSALLQNQEYAFSNWAQNHTNSFDVNELFRIFSVISLKKIFYENKNF